MHDQSNDDDLLAINKNLLDKLNKDIKAGLIDTGSVNSQNGRFSHSDTIKRIRTLIAGKKAPRTLVLAMQILFWVIIGSITISIYAATLKIKGMNYLKQSLIDANSINKMNILINKIGTYLEMEALEKSPYNLNFSELYTPEIYNFIKTDTSDSFKLLDDYYQELLTDLNLGKDRPSSNILKDYFFITSEFNLHGLTTELNYLTYMNYCLESLFAYYTNSQTELSSIVQVDNIEEQLFI